VQGTGQRDGLPCKRRGGVPVAAVAVLAGATNFREIGDNAGDLSQRLLEHLGGRRHLLKHKIVAPSEKRIRTLIQQIDATVLDGIIGGWLRDLAEAGRLKPLPAIDGKAPAPRGADRCCRCGPCRRHRPDGH
jgi:hypothetical protein